MDESRKQKLSVAAERALADKSAIVLDTFGGKLRVKFERKSAEEQQQILAKAQEIFDKGCRQK